MVKSITEGEVDQQSQEVGSFFFRPFAYEKAASVSNNTTVAANVLPGIMDVNFSEPGWLHVGSGDVLMRRCSSLSFNTKLTNIMCEIHDTGSTLYRSLFNTRQRFDQIRCHDGNRKGRSFL